MKISYPILVFALASFSPAGAQTVDKIRLINADTELPVAGFDPLVDGAVLDLRALPTRNLSIEAITIPATVGSVRFGYDGNPNFKTEGVAPYSFTGDSNGDFDPFTPTVGSHTVTATAFSGGGASGTASPTLTVNFTVTDGVPPEPPDPADSAVLQTPEKGIYGELKQWHRVTIAFERPASSENATPNPFLAYRLNVIFTHVSSGRTMTVPGYYAADGFAGETGADSGNIWRVGFAPPETGEWTYSAQFRTGSNIAVDDVSGAGVPATLDGNASGIVTGGFTVEDTDKEGPRQPVARCARVCRWPLSPVGRDG